MSVVVRIKNDSKNELPKYASLGDSGFDLRANVARSTTILPGRRAIIPTGIHVDIPEGYEIQIRSRSGLAAKYGIFVLNSPGTIDAGYVDEICVILFNLGEENFTIEPGDRIAQAVLMKVEHAELEETKEDIVKDNDRGGGLGHTGVK